MKLTHYPADRMTLKNKKKNVQPQQPNHKVTVKQQLHQQFLNGNTQNVNFFKVTEHLGVCEEKQKKRISIFKPK